MDCSIELQYCDMMLGSYMTSRGSLFGQWAILQLAYISNIHTLCLSLCN